MAASASAARLLRSWALPSGLRLELHLTPDVVAHPPLGRCDALVNPANEALVGTKLPYFPMPFDPPPGLQTSRWCGMEAGENMFYPAQVVDGRVHALGGDGLRQACQAFPELEPGVRCRVGGAVVTPAVGELQRFYSQIIHTVPPMYGTPNWSSALASCYSAALAAAWAHGSPLQAIASPLLGAGARGAPVAEAARVAARALVAAPAAGASRAPLATVGCIVCLAVREEAIAVQVEAEVCLATSAAVPT
eukprot:CAMPEP_0117516330 /NCGR_PEP_ID=MMETSP0784-20121206/31039_1 /TAXON_ID=39447 /ORGANISM="" /LENGTH=248 /DNA_ID=CAMNT_0005312173 /DNA_START=95 /DNA_END=838 /DNA_ORIENTATION=-